MTKFVKAFFSKRMENIGKLIRDLRINKGYPLRKVAAFLYIDQAVLSKMERGKRKISKQQVIKLAGFFNYDEKELLITYFSDLIASQIGDEECASEALKAAEKKIEYKRLKNQNQNATAESARKIISEFPHILKAWIFGSYSRNEQSPKSDIDIAVKADNTVSYFDLAEIQYKLERKLKKKVDIGFIDSFKPHIYKNLEPDLRLIYERPKN